MGWNKARNRQRSSIVKFCKEREAHYVPLTSRLKNGERSCTTFVHTSHGSIDELAMITLYGLVLPVFQNHQAMMQKDDKKLAGLMRKYSNKIYSIMGLSAEVNRMVALLKITPRASIKYHLMLLKRAAFLRMDLNNSTVMQSTPGIVVRRASLSDTAYLLPLQREYEREEVLLRPADFSENRCRSVLSHCLKNEVVFLAEQDGRSISKAGTNARGFVVDQIGGVYTCKNKRAQGIAYAVMTELIRYIFQNKTAISLFVKKNNAPALALYKKLGFIIQESYQIDYTFD